MNDTTTAEFTEAVDMDLASLKAIFGESDTLPVTFVISGRNVTAKRDGSEFKKKADTVAGQSLEDGIYTALMVGEVLTFSKVETKPVKQSCTSMERL